MVHIKRKPVPVEGNQDEGIQLWAEAQWREADIIIRRVKESVQIIDLERSSTEVETTISSQTTAYSNANSISTETVRPNHKEREVISWNGPNDPANPMNWATK